MTGEPLLCPVCGGPPFGICAIVIDLDNQKEEEQEMAKVDRDPMSIKCPTCHSSPDRRCVNEHGTAIIPYHQTRVETAREDTWSSPTMTSRFDTPLVERIRAFLYVSSQAEGLMFQAADRIEHLEALLNSKDKVNDMAVDFARSCFALLKFMEEEGDMANE